MKVTCKSASAGSAQGELVATLESLTPVLSGGECRIMARFRSASRSVVAFVEPKDFPAFAKALNRKGSLKGINFLEGERLIGCQAHLETKGDQTTIRRLKNLETPDRARQKAELDREMKELTSAK
jgi:hypothetical protein